MEVGLETILMFVVTLGCSALGWWLRQVAAAVKVNTEMNLIQQGELKALETNNHTKFEALKEVTETQIGTLTRDINRLVETLDKQNELTEKRLLNLEKTK